MITISLTLSLRQAVQLLAFAQGLEPDDSLTSTGHEGKATPKHLEIGSRNKLEYLLDDQLRKLVTFAVSQNGTFLNKDLAKELGVATPLTSIYLGHLTRKLRNSGIDPKNWYAKHKTQNGTLLTVRDDVMDKFRETAQSKLSSIQTTVREQGRGKG
jgi:hypothetical protein